MVTSQPYWPGPIKMSESSPVLGDATALAASVPWTTTRATAGILACKSTLGDGSAPSTENCNLRRARTFPEALSVMIAFAPTPCAVSRTTPNAASSLFLTGALRIRHLSAAPESYRSRSNSAAIDGRPHHIWNAVGRVTAASPKATAERTMSPHDKSGGGGSENIRPSWQSHRARQVVGIIPIENAHIPGQSGGRQSDLQPGEPAGLQPRVAEIERIACK